MQHARPSAGARRACAPRASPRPACGRRARARGRRRSGPSPPRPTSSRATSRICRSTATAACFLGPSASLVAETAAPFLWTLSAGADGTLWAGSGNEGKVLQDRQGRQASRRSSTPPSSKCTRSPRRPTAASTSATSPDGKIYSVAADGTSKTFFDPEDKYIWALAVDKAGNVFAATGDKGVIYKITPDGKGARFYRTNATQRRLAGLHANGELHRRHRIARARLPDRRGRQGVRAARLAVPRDPRRCASPTTGRSTRRP